MKESLTTRRCPTCGAAAARLFASENIQPEKLNAYAYASRKEPEYMRYELLQCLSCKLAYASRRAQTDLNAAYASAAYDSDEEAVYAARSYMQALAPFLDELPCREFAVDVGAGNGAFLPFLLESGFQDALGVEPSKAAIAAAPDSIRPLLKEEAFFRQSLGGRKPSLICSFMTLEHLSDYMGFLYDAFEELTPGGMLALVTHDYTAWINRLLGNRSPIMDIEHLQLFCPEALKRALYKVGFSEVKIQPLTNQYPMRYLLKLFPFPSHIKKRLTPYMYAPNRFEKIFRYPLRLPLGNILSVCKKY